jgi:hypothetical protein
MGEIKYSTNYGNISLLCLVKDLFRERVCGWIERKGTTSELWDELFEG